MVVTMPATCSCCMAGANAGNGSKCGPAHAGFESLEVGSIDQISNKNISTYIRTQHTFIISPYTAPQAHA